MSWTVNQGNAGLIKLAWKSSFFTYFERALWLWNTFWKNLFCLFYLFLKNFREIGISYSLNVWNTFLVYPICWHEIACYPLYFNDISCTVQNFIYTFTFFLSLVKNLLNFLFRFSNIFFPDLLCCFYSHFFCFVHY